MPETLIYIALVMPLIGLFAFFGAVICFLDKNRKDKYLPAKLLIAASVLMVGGPVCLAIGAGSEQAAAAKALFATNETIPS